MIKHTVSNSRQFITYYFQQKYRYDNALSSQYGENSRLMIQNADVAYDHEKREFVKERMSREDLMNALLMVKRNQQFITDEMLELVEIHK